MNIYHSQTFLKISAVGGTCSNVNEEARGKVKNGIQKRLINCKKRDKKYQNPVKNKRPKKSKSYENGYYNLNPTHMGLKSLIKHTLTGAYIGRTQWEGGGGVDIFIYILFLVVGE